MEQTTPWFTNFFVLLPAGFLTLAIMSFLYKDNPFYRFAEHLFAGLSAGYYMGLIWQSTIIQQLVDPINGHWSSIMSNEQVGFHIMKIGFLIIAGLMGVLMFSRFFPKMSWISRYPLAFVIGNTAGVTLMSELHGKLLAQVKATFVNFTDPFFLSVVIFLGVISTLVYFYFSKEHKGLLGGTARLGIWFIMIAFGAHFGYTVMGRISLLIGQVNFIFMEWLRIVT